MGNNSFLRAALLVAALSENSAYGKTIYFGGGIETVAVAYGTTTVLRFEEPVKTISNAADFIIKPVSDENPDYAVLSIEPRVMSGKLDTVFILSSGEIAKLRLSVVPRQAGMKTESIYEIKSQRSLIETRAAATPYVGRLELMTAMIRGDQVTGYEVTKLGRDVSTGQATKVVLEKVYSGDEFKGYVYEIENLSKKATLDIDIRKLEFGSPNQAVLAYSDLDLLEAHGSTKDKTRLLIVTKPASTYRDAVLPIRVTKKPESAEGDKHD